MISHANNQPGNNPTLRSENTFVSWNCFKDGAFSDVITQVADQWCATSGKEFRKTTPELHCWVPWNVSNMASLMIIHHTSESFFKGYYNVKTNADLNRIKRLKVETKQLQFYR